ncbi:Vault protein inter-alpha-trypsin domain-containing protein [Pseudoxanthobacter soli DSM 19599]|uniref:Vault protein inter-alpha-trypsin domain-containing protein n=1 Tax=Pseudoxanthobacter soli DSM 19599 TaxID=1123029 RepID=A0A1M7ZQB4_9HYPH|nr:VIT domain-containing protein [Pseudoxanthobacter soli]SHO66999.1 Vault protein inter-alpha-trypsin domain-containing protein [Pseudoxanthobacter soli DSM 19599]
MTEPLIDPLQPFLRPAPAAPAPLLLTRTDLELYVTPGSARLRATRVLVNRETERLEAVLTLPPALDGEVVFGAAVTIGGERWSGRARAHRSGETAYDGATVEGQRALLLEEAKQGWRVFSVAGIAPGEEGAIEIDSVVDLAAGTTHLLLRPAADADRLTSRLPDHQTPRLTGTADAMTLTVWTDDGIEISVDATFLPIGRAFPIDGAPLALRVTSAPDATSARPRSAEDRAAAAALDARRRIAEILAGPKPIDRAAIRALSVEANLLTAETSLVFIGPAGEANGVLPVMRKVALFDGRSALTEPPPLPASPPVLQTVPEWQETPGPEILEEPGSIRPGRAGRYRSRFGRPAAKAPWMARLANWLRHSLRRKSRNPSLAELGQGLWATAPLVVWSRDGALALRSGDAAHLPEDAALAVRAAARHSDVIATATALRLPTEQLAVGLLAGAAIRQSAAPDTILSALFPDNPLSPPLPFQRLLAAMILD